MPGPSAEGAAARVGGAGPAALLLASEAAWVSLAFGAFADGTAGPGRPALELPYLAFVVPAVVSLAAVSVVRGGTRPFRSAPRRWARGAVTAAVVLAGAALSAGIVAGLTAPAATWTVAFHPWSLPEHAAVAGRAARWAWAVAVLAWGRGAWVAASPPSLRQAASSLAVGAVVFLVVFARQAAAGPGRFDRATGAAGWLCFVAFVTGVTAAAWAYERAVERRVFGRARPAPGGGWFSVLVVPFGAVALAAFFVGGAAEFVGTGVARAVHAVGGAVATSLAWLVDHLPRIFVRPRSGAVSRAGVPGNLVPPRDLHRLPTHTPTALGIAMVCVLGALVLVALAVGVRALARRLRRRRAGDEDDVVREFVFTWRHLGTQLRRSLLALLARLGRPFRRGRRHIDAAGVVRGGEPDGADADAVRAAYRRFLVAARGAAWGRAHDETPRELALRLSRAPELAHVGAPELRSLTTLYENVRYADSDSGTSETSGTSAGRAATDAEVLVRALGASPAGDRPPRE